MSLYNKALFYPTLLYNVVMEKVTSRKWYNRIDDTVILGALPFKGMTEVIYQKENVRGVVSLNEQWELDQFVNSEQEWAAYGIDQLKIPTTDYSATPSQENIWRAVDFILEHMKNKTSVYVHCKAGRCRSTTVVACYLIKAYGLQPNEAVEFIRKKRPHICLGDMQLNSIRTFYERCQREYSSTTRTGHSS